MEYKCLKCKKEICASQPYYSLVLYRLHGARALGTKHICKECFEQDASEDYIIDSPEKEKLEESECLHTWCDVDIKTNTYKCRNCKAIMSKQMYDMHFKKHSVMHYSEDTSNYLSAIDALLPTERCPWCNGAGYYQWDRYEHTACAKCDGNGYIIKEKK